MRAQLSFRRAALAVACSLSLVSFARADEPADTKPPVNNSSLNAPLFYQLVLGEIEFRSGETLMAYQLMLDAAKKTADEALFRRASTMALQMRDGELALKAIEAWRGAAPQSLEASRYEVQVLMALQRPADAMNAVGNLIQLTPASERSSLLAALPRLFARNKDAKQNLQLAEPILKPWVDEPATRQAAQVTLGRFLIAAGESERALELVQKAHADDRSADGPALLALELMSTNPQAEAVVSDYLQAKPGSTSLRVVYGRILASQQRTSEAAEQLQRVTRDDPALAAPWLALGALKVELQQPAEAKEALQEYLRRLDTPPPAGNESAAAAAAPDMDGGEAEPPPSAGSTQAYFLLSRAAAQQKDFDAASAWLDKVNDPQQAMDVLLRRANLLVDQGKLQKAIELVRNAPNNTPDAPRDKLTIEAQLYTNAKQWSEAQAVLAKANQRFPNDADLLYQQAMMEEKLNRVPEMERLLRRVIELRPDNHNAYNALGYSLAERDMRLPEARDLIVKALSLAPGEPFITDSLGWVEYRLGRRQVAIRLLQHAYRLRPDSEIGVHLGEVLWVEGQRDEARRVLREVRAKDPSNEPLAQTLKRLKVDL